MIKFLKCRKYIILKLISYIKTFIKKIGESYYFAKPSRLFIFTYLSLFLAVSRNPVINKIYYVNLAFLSITLILRIVKRTIDLKNMKYIQIYNFTKDREKRAENFIDSAILIFVMLLLIIGMQQNITGNLYQYIFIILLLFCILLLFLYITIKNSSIWLGALSIIFTSLPGMLIFFATFTVILTCLVDFIAQENFIIRTQFIEDFPLALLVLLTDGYKIYFLILLLISLFLQLIFVLIYPSYDLNILSFSFKIISLVMVILSALIFFNQSNINGLVNKSKIELSEQLESDYIEGDIKSDTDYNEIKKLIDTIDSEKLVSTLNIFTLPFTLGSVLALFLIDLRKYKVQKKADKLLEIILEKVPCFPLNSIESNYQNKIIKECIYYGGSEFIRLLKIYNLKTTSPN